MQRKFVSNLFFVVFLNLLIKPFWILGIDVAVQNRVGAEEYGLYYPIFGFSILLNIILDFGITNYNNRNIAQHEHMLGRYFSGIFNVKLFLGILYLVITLLLGWLIGYGQKEIYLLLILCFNQFLASMILYLRSNLSGLHLFKTEATISILDRLLMIIICGALLWGGLVEESFQIEWFIYAQLVAYVVTALVAFLMVLMRAKFFRIKVDIVLFRIILKQSLPFALLVLLMSFYYRLDSVMIERLLPNGKFEAGIYAQAYRILEGFNMFAYMFATLLLPIFSRMIKEKAAVNGLVRTSFNLIFMPVCAIAAVSILYPNEIMALLYWENIESSAQVYEVLMLSFVSIALTYIYGTLLTANGNLKELNRISLAGLLINLSLNATLIPDFGAYGAAIATLITQFIIVILQIMICKKEFAMGYSLSFISKVLIILILGLGISISTKQLGLGFWIHSLVIGSIFIILPVVFRLYDLKQIKLILQRKD